MTGEVLLLGMFGVAAVAAVLGRAAFFVVGERTEVIIERLGRFHRVAPPGLHVRWPLVDRIRGEVDMRVVPLHAVAEVGTLDGVFVRVRVALRHQVLPGCTEQAFYQWPDVDRRLAAIVSDVLGPWASDCMLHEMLRQRDVAAALLATHLSGVLAGMGHALVDVRITDIEPPAGVRAVSSGVHGAVARNPPVDDGGLPPGRLVIVVANGNTHGTSLAEEIRRALTMSPERRSTPRDHSPAVEGQQATAERPLGAGTFGLAHTPLDVRQDGGF